jgi:uncharacterized Tic20 family protein
MERVSMDLQLKNSKNYQVTFTQTNGTRIQVFISFVQCWIGSKLAAEMEDVVSVIPNHILTLQTTRSCANYKLLMLLIKANLEHP